VVSAREEEAVCHLPNYVGLSVVLLQFCLLEMWRALPGKNVEFGGEEGGWQTGTTMNWAGPADAVENLEELWGLLEEPSPTSWRTLGGRRRREEEGQTVREEEKIEKR
jgi:hypothetical protein